MRDHPHDYIIENTSFSELRLSDIIHHASEMVDTSARDFFDVQPESIEINVGVFTNRSSILGFPLVSVSQSGDSIVISCPCKSSKKKLCTHYKAQVMYTILDRPYLRIFYDAAFRELKIRQAAKEYGMELEPNLEDYFDVEYTNKAFEIRPKNKELFKFNATTSATVAAQLLPKKETKLAALEGEKLGKKMILVFRKHKYYDQLNIELFEGEVTKEGKVKNPLTAVEPMPLIWKTQQIEAVKFFTGVSAFQNNHSDSEPQAAIEALKMIVNNPLKLDVFSHDKNISTSVTANSIVPMQLNTIPIDIKLFVFKKDPFYEVSGELIVDSKAHALKSLQIKYHYFVQIGRSLNLIANMDLLRVVEFFKANNQKVIIHASKYEAFYQDILAKLEDRISISYGFIQPATKQQIEEQNFDQTPEKFIYLSDHENYVSIIPVVRYGNIEIPVFSRKQLFDTDQNGNVFQVDRDNELEVQFTSVLMRQHPDFEEQLELGEYFYLHKEKFLNENWFLDAFEEWKNQGIVILGFNDLKKNKLNANKAIVLVNVSSGINWFDTSVAVKYGEQQASVKQLHKAIKNKSKFVQLDDGTMGILPEEWMQKLAEYFHLGEVEKELIRIPKSNFASVNNLFETEVLSKEVQEELGVYTKKFAGFEKMEEVAVPPELNATLRDYQKQGLNWLNLLDDFNFGACLADDMGLGKTVQVIAFILSQRAKQRHNTNLVVVPTSLLFNWQAEVAKFAPSIQLFTHYGANRIKSHKEFGRYEIILTTYGMLLSDIHYIKEYSFNYVFLDESQAIKNPESQRYKAARMLQSRNRVVLTGTPIENNTFDIYGQLSFACPGLLGNKQYFKDIYSIPIDRFEDNRRAIELQEKIKPFILRRTKKEVAQELPEKTEMVIYCEMGEEQRKVYSAYEKEIRDFISAKHEDEITKDSMHVLTGLTKLRQICNSPTLVKGEESTVVSSTKIEVLMEHIENKSPQHKILVFSQFVSMLDLIKKELEYRNIPFEYLTGQTRDREAKVTAFQGNDHVRVFLISLKAGGTGLNLTEADYVYLVDPWWNPAVENQAIDRCYRIGQKKNVIAVRLICTNTVEEKIMKLQESKNKLVNDLIKTDSSILKSFTKTDLMQMVGAV